MLAVFHPPAVAVLSALPGLSLFSDASSIVPFSAAENLAAIYAHMSVGEMSMLVAGCPIGAAVSSIFAGIFCDSAGPLAVLRLASAVWASACVGTYFSPSNVFVVLCKLAKGFAVGLFSVAAPVYAFETLSGPARARSVAVFQFLGAVGQISVYAVARVLALSFPPDEAFHYTWLVECAWGGLVLVGSVCLPETPATLARRGKWAAASRNFERLCRKSAVKTLTPVPFSTPSFASMFSADLWRCTFTAVLLQVLAHATGVCGTAHFAHYIAGFCLLPEHTTQTLFLVFYVLSVVFSSVPVFLSGRFRRKDLLGLGYLVLSSSYATLGLLAYFYAVESPVLALFAPSAVVDALPASAVVAISAFALSGYFALVSTTSLLYSEETFPPGARAKGHSIAVSGGLIADALISGTAGVTDRLVPFVVLFVLAGLSVFALIFSLFLGETREYSAMEGVPYPNTEREVPLYEIDEKSEEKAELIPVPPPETKLERSVSENTEKTLFSDHLVTANDCFANSNQIKSKARRKSAESQASSLGIWSDLGGSLG